MRSKLIIRLATLVLSLGALLLIGGVAQGGVSMHNASVGANCAQITAHLTDFENPTTVIHAEANGVALPDRTLTGKTGDVAFPWTPKVGANTFTVSWFNGTESGEVNLDCTPPTTTTPTTQPTTSTTTPKVIVPPNFTG